MRGAVLSFIQDEWIGLFQIGLVGGCIAFCLAGAAFLGMASVDTGHPDEETQVTGGIAIASLIIMIVSGLVILAHSALQ